MITHTYTRKISNRKKLKKTILFNHTRYIDLPHIDHTHDTVPYILPTSTLLLYVDINKLLKISKNIIILQSELRKIQNINLKRFYRIKQYISYTGVIYILDLFDINVVGVKYLNSYQLGVNTFYLNSLECIYNNCNNTTCICSIKGDRERGESSKLEGVSNTTNRQQGVSELSNELEGVSNSTNGQQGVTKLSIEQHPLNNNTIQYPLNNNTTQYPLNNNPIQHPPNNNTTQYPPHYNILRVITYLKNIYPLSSYNILTLPLLTYKTPLIYNAITPYTGYIKINNKKIQIYDNNGAIDNDTVSIRDSKIISVINRTDKEFVCCFKDYIFYNENSSLDDEIEENSSDRGILESVNNKDSNIKGVNNKDSNIKGVNESSNEQQGVNKLSNEQQGVNNNDRDIKGVNNNDSSIKGVNENTDKQHPFNTTNITDRTYSIVVPCDLKIPLIRIKTVNYKELLNKKITVRILPYLSNKRIYGKIINVLGNVGDMFVETQCLLLKHCIEYDSIDIERIRRGCTQIINTINRDKNYIDPNPSITLNTPIKPNPTLTLNTCINTCAISSNKTVSYFDLDVYESSIPFLKGSNVTDSKREDLTYLNVFSIDPLGCTDIDDAISVRILKDNSSSVNTLLSSSSINTPLDNSSIINTPLDNSSIVNTLLSSSIVNTPLYNSSIINTPLDNSSIVNTPRNISTDTNTPLSTNLITNTPLTNTTTVEIGVHIADVSHFVQSGSEMDKRAMRRGTSVYVEGGRVDMIEEWLSGDVCSLREGCRRYAYSVIIEVECYNDIKGVGNSGRELGSVNDMGSKLEGISDKDSKLEGVGNKDNKLKGINNMERKLEGISNSTSKQQGVSNSTNKQDPVNNLSNTLPPFNNTTYTNNNLSNTFTSVRISNVRFTKSLIKNTKAFTYEEAFENIKNIKNKYSKDMNLLWKIVEIIRNERKKEAMDLSVGGILTNFLVEEIMVLTNSLVGKELIRKRGKGCLLRIHTESEAIRSMCTEGVTYKDSSIKGMEGVNYMDSSIKGGVGVNNKDSNLKGVNYKDNIKDLKDTKDINNISSKHHIIRPSNVDIKVWRSYMARCMDRAKYFINNGNIKELKHYGLGLDVYTHFTSPIRRYADILVHRQLYEVCSNNSGCDTINTEISNNRIENHTGSSITSRFDNNNDSPTNNNKNKNSSSSTNNTNNTITILSDCTVNRLNDKNYSAKVVSRESRMLKIYYQVSGSVMEGCVIGVKDNGVIIYIPDCDVEGFVKVEEENKYKLFDNIRVKVGGNDKKFFSGRGYDFEIVKG
ncbi:RNB domain-containing protein [Hamiltosporidium tvaerminnensis]|uniref:DIS3-like exonuclease 1 n=1 Tax=Hamiltosporidium tvaerminnensis TaxID=1176355 RepID=A0A4Q9LS66_9MICR|nr:RNB domain-containing protein [Hamiltosporidium tvaerminnensis]